MRGLFLKVFTIFWIAQSLIFVISTALIIQHNYNSPGPDLLSDVLSSSLHNEAAESVASFERGGCDALAVYAAEHNHVITLANAAGKNLCFSSEEQDSVRPAYPNRIIGQQVKQQFVWRVPITSSNGTRYIFLLSRPHIPHPLAWRLLHFAFPQLPVAIAVGGVATFILILLFTRPLARLRSAARQLAQGNLGSRVEETTGGSRMLEGDEFHALVRDFNHMAEHLESQVNAQKLLLRDVSHELRSPLARLSVALELTREDGNAEISPYLDRIERETERLNQLIGQLLTLSSMESIDAAHNLELLSLNDLIEEIIPDAEYEARERQCSVIFHAETNCIVRGNTELLYRAFENVIRNAIRYTVSHSEVEIRLYAEMSLNPPMAVVEILDHGPGIPESEIHDIFRPFHRVDRARSSDTGGFGVGLAIAERAIRLHKGTIIALNASNGGAVIRMKLPMCESTLNARQGNAS